jgi:hypothetical protein
MGPIVIVMVVLAVAGGLWYSWYRKKQRRLGLAAFAGRNGLQYSQADTFGLLERPFGLLRMGDGRGCENVLSGSWQGLRCREADYWYYTESTDSKGHTTRSYRYFSILIGELGVEVPDVSIQKESVLSRLADHLGFHDIEFESEEFNREFQVKAANREFAFKLVDARMMGWLMSTGGRFGFAVSGPELLVWSARLGPAELEALFGAALGFHDHVPRLVREPGPAADAKPSDAPSGPVAEPTETERSTS